MTARARLLHHNCAPAHSPGGNVTPVRNVTPPRRRPLIARHKDLIGIVMIFLVTILLAAAALL